MKRLNFNEPKTKEKLFLALKIIEFCLVFSLLLFPPFLSKPSSQEITVKLQLLPVLTTLLISIYLYVSTYFFPSKSEYLKKDKKIDLKGLISLLISGILLITISWAINSYVEIKGIETAKILKDGLNLQMILLTCLVLFIYASFEEVLYRKYLVNTLSGFLSKIKYHKIIAIFLSSILFALAHLYNGAAAVIFSFLCGLTFSFLYHFSGNILLSILLHSAYNILIFLIS